MIQTFDFVSGTVLGPVISGGRYMYVSDHEAAMKEKDLKLESFFDEGVRLATVNGELREQVKKTVDNLGLAMATGMDWQQKCKVKDEQIAILKNVLISDEKQITNLIKRNAEMRDDCIKTAHDRDIANAEISRLRLALDSLSREDVKGNDYLNKRFAELCRIPWHEVIEDTPGESVYSDCTCGKKYCGPFDLRHKNPDFVADPRLVLREMMKREDWRFFFIYLWGKHHVVPNDVLAIVSIPVIYVSVTTGLLVKAAIEFLEKEEGKGKEMKCPQCGEPLIKVVRPSNSYLNDEQFAAVRAGDYYCTKCPSNSRGNTEDCYWWTKEVLE